MGLTRSDIREGMETLGLKSGDCMLVHSSLSSFGHVEGGAEAVIGGLLDAVGPEGTVMVPTLNGKPEDSPATPPVFDVRYTKCWTGAIPETFRHLQNARRSLHPTHSVSAIGGRRDELVSGHENTDSPCDRKSPYYKNALYGGYIVLIGVNQRSNTTFHCCEELAGVPYHLQNEITECHITGYKGETVIVKNRLHNWSHKETDFNKLEERFIDKGIMKTGGIGNSTIRVVNASLMLELTVEILGKDPYFLYK